MSGSITRVNIHEDHIDDARDNLGKIWDNVLTAFADEEKIASAAVVVNPKSAGQLAQHRKNMLSHVANRPVGVFVIERTSDRAQREKAKGSH